MGSSEFTRTYFVLCLLVGICMGARSVTYAQEAQGSPAAADAGQDDSAATPVEAQRRPEIVGQALRVLLDCFRCDDDYLRREITFVNYVRDRQDAQVHVLATFQPTGGGMELTLNFIGLEQFAGNDDTHYYNSSRTNTDDENRAGLAQVLRVGFLHYIIDTPAAQQIEIRQQSLTRQRPAMAQPEDDPWNFWVFRTSMNVRASGEASRTNQNLNGSFSANRTTQDWKFSLRVNGQFRESVNELSSGTFVNTTTNYGFNGQVVQTLGEHWGASMKVAATASTFLNQDLTFSFAPGIEYNVFPYAESSRRRLTVTYEVGGSAFNYEEETLFGKTSETLFDHAVITTLDVEQPWGDSRLQFDYSNYLDDFDKFSARLSGNLSFRITRGLSLNVNAGTSLIRNQLYLPVQDLSDEEILLQRRALATDSRSNVQFGFSYTFGSIFNNVVNPRFDGARGGEGRFR